MVFDFIHLVGCIIATLFTLLVYVVAWWVIGSPDD